MSQRAEEKENFKQFFNRFSVILGGNGNGKENVHFLEGSWEDRRSINFCLIVIMAIYYSFFDSPYDSCLLSP